MVGNGVQPLLEFLVCGRTECHVVDDRLPVEVLELEVHPLARDLALEPVSADVKPCEILQVAQLRREFAIQVSLSEIQPLEAFQLAKGAGNRDISQAKEKGFTQVQPFQLLQVAEFRWKRASRKEQAVAEVQPFEILQVAEFPGDHAPPYCSR